MPIAARSSAPGQVRLAGVVVELLAGRHLARARRHVLEQRQVAARRARDVRRRVGVVLVPLHARGHLQHVLDRHAVVAAAGELRQVARDRLVDAADVAVGDGGADQHRDHRLGDRERDPTAVLVVAERVALEQDLAVLDHQQAGDPLVAHVVVERVGGAVELVGHLGEVARRRDQWVGLAAGLDQPRVVEPVDVAVARHLLLGRPPQHAIARPEVGLIGARRGGGGSSAARDGVGRSSAVGAGSAGGGGAAPPRDAREGAIRAPRAAVRESSCLVPPEPRDCSVTLLCRVGVLPEVPMTRTALASRAPASPRRILRAACCALLGDRRRVRRQRRDRRAHEARRRRRLGRAARARHRRHAALRRRRQPAGRGDAGRAPRQDRPLRRRRVAQRRRQGADDPRHHLPALLAVEAGDRGGGDDPLRGGQVPAHRSGRQVPARVRRHEGLRRRGERADQDRAGAADHDPAPAHPHRGLHLRLLPDVRSRRCTARPGPAARRRRASSAASRSGPRSSPSSRSSRSPERTGTTASRSTSSAGWSR